MNRTKNSRIFNSIAVSFIVLMFTACVPSLVEKTADASVPANYHNSQDTLNSPEYANEAVQDTINSAQVNWKEFFTDPYLNKLIEIGLENNQELNITLQEIMISQNEIQARKGEYLPYLGLRAGAGLDKAAEYTRDGAVEENLNIREEEAFPEPLPDYMIGAYATWEVDIWGKLHNAKKASVLRYLSSVEGKNFMVTNLIAEIANSYYELLALDNQLAIVERNIDIQSNALKIVRLQKQAARVTELAVKKFEAEVFKTRSLQFKFKQQIVETENRINFLIGRYPQPIERNAEAFVDLIPTHIKAGIPSQLLENRPDVKQAELDLKAAELDIQVAKARFYPSLGISASLGYQAFNPKYLLKTPQSLLYSLAGDITAPLINRNAIKADYQSANAMQIQAVYNYERTVLNAYIEVANQVSKIDNLGSSYDLIANQVAALTKSIDISNDLFKNARADYMEVLLTQRDALESKFELIETKKEQMNALVNMYQALGGGWN
ncbi:TolC family protein [Mesonia oceanica]|tara:strand:- start:4303 stop:5784 length:1482 start_codon:yes stop_codon:yes gene_type:complete